jgi:hypothetical protein
VTLRILAFSAQQTTVRERETQHLPQTRSMTASGECSTRESERAESRERERERAERERVCVCVRKWKTGNTAERERNQKKQGTQENGDKERKKERNEENNSTATLPLDLLVGRTLLPGSRRAVAGLFARAFARELTAAYVLTHEWKDQ